VFNIGRGTETSLTELLPSAHPGVGAELDLEYGAAPRRVKGVDPAAWLMWSRPRKARVEWKAEAAWRQACPWLVIMVARAAGGGPRSERSGDAALARQEEAVRPPRRWLGLGW